MPGTHTHTAAPPPAAEEGIDPRLVVVKRQPLNAETPLAEQVGVITPTPLFYVRNNFALPAISLADWRLPVGGEVERRLELTYDELLRLPGRTLLATLECAGNGRIFMQPLPPGEPWQYGAVSTAEWAGVSLAAVLEAAGVTGAALEVLVTGADSGMVEAREAPIHYARSLPLEKALHPDTLLVHTMNGEPLTAQHGFPLRLLVPGWYGMAAVKWVARIDALARPFDGHFQAERYVVQGPGDEDVARVPLSTAGVRSLITAPGAGAELPRGEQRVCGLAWSGAAPIARVDVSVDGGATWGEATFASGPERYAWRRWEFTWRAARPGPATLLSRAFDALGRTQPAEPAWNRLGYANNAIQAVRVQVR
jgi:DMSO/TMAO reductase YedYZ molybdopterin-dependent catalytic subunit